MVATFLAESFLTHNLKSAASWSYTGDPSLNCAFKPVRFAYCFSVDGVSKLLGSVLVGAFSNLRSWGPPRNSKWSFSPRHIVGSAGKRWHKHRKKLGSEEICILSLIARKWHLLKYLEGQEKILARERRSTLKEAASFCNLTWEVIPKAWVPILLDSPRSRGVAVVGFWFLSFSPLRAVLQAQILHASPTRSSLPGTALISSICPSASTHRQHILVFQRFSIHTAFLRLFLRDLLVIKCGLSKYSHSMLDRSLNPKTAKLCSPSKKHTSISGLGCTQPRVWGWVLGDFLSWGTQMSCVLLQIICYCVTVSILEKGLCVGILKFCPKRYSVRVLSWWRNLGLS